MELMSVIRSASPSIACGVLALLVASYTTPASAQPGVAAPVVTQPESDRLALPLTIDEAVGMALEQNIQLRVERLTPRVTGLDVSQAYAAWLPAFTSNTVYRDSTQPVQSFLESQDQALVTRFFEGQTGIEQVLPTGGQYSLSFQGFRNETNNQFVQFNPTTRGNLAFNFSQPLLRNRSIDNTRQQIVVSRNNLAISELDLRNTVVSTIRNVKNAYWDLVVALSSLEVQRQTLDLSRQTLADNRKRVEVGTMAPIDIVQAEADEAANEELVIVAEQTVAQAQDRLRALILDPDAPQFWDTDFDPRDSPTLSPTPVDIDSAVGAAMANRLDLKRARAQLDNNQTRIRFLKNQTLPQLNANVQYGLAGLGGRQLRFVPDPDNPLGESPVGVAATVPYNRVLGDIAGFNFPTWSVSMQFRYPIGPNPERVNLTRAEMQNDQSLLQLRDSERQVVQQVRDLGRQANTNLKRVSSTQAARGLAEKRLEAEEKKFGVGLATTFNVLQAQRDLANARNNEQRAILDYVKSMVDFEAAQEASISGGAAGVSVVGTGGNGGLGTGVGTGTTQGVGLPGVGGNIPGIGGGQ